MTSKDKRESILVVDDIPATVEAIQRNLDSQGRRCGRAGPRLPPVWPAFRRTDCGSTDRLSDPSATRRNRHATQWIFIGA